MTGLKVCLPASEAGIEGLTLLNLIDWFEGLLHVYQTHLESIG